MPTARLACGHGDSLDGPACSKPTPVARGQNATFLVFFMVWARGQSRGAKRQTQEGVAGWPDFDPDFADESGLIEPYLSAIRDRQ